MSLRFFSLLIITFCAQLTVAQETLSGKITDGNEPIPYVKVKISSTSALNGQELKANVLTDFEGNFILTNLPKGMYTIEFSAFGYEILKQTIAIPTAHQLITLKKSEQVLDEMTVSGTLKEVSKKESTVNVEVFSSKFFKKNPTPSVYESLQNVNGVRPQLNCNICNTGDIHINGLEGPYTMILIDGMPIVSSLSTVYGLSGIPNSLIERIEIVKGPASTLYGSEAIGGVINLITKKQSVLRSHLLMFSPQVGWKPMLTSHLKRRSERRWIY